MTLFDNAGAHPPTLAGHWTTTTDDLVTEAVRIDLGNYGITVRGPANLPFIDDP